jgi:hypothetical protein
MRRNLAHLLRRVARVMIGWSTKLDPPVNYNITVNGAISDAIDRVRRIDAANQFHLRY